MITVKKQPHADFRVYSYGQELHALCDSIAAYNVFKQKHEAAGVVTQFDNEKCQCSVRRLVFVLGTKCFTNSGVLNTTEDAEHKFFHYIASNGLTGAIQTKGTNTHALKDTLKTAWRICNEVARLSAIYRKNLKAAGAQKPQLAYTPTTQVDYTSELDIVMSKLEFRIDGGSLVESPPRRPSHNSETMVKVVKFVLEVCLFGDNFISCADAMEILTNTTDENIQKLVSRFNSN